MTAVQVEKKSYEMPPREGISIAYFLTVADALFDCAQDKPALRLQG